MKRLSFCLLFFVFLSACGSATATPTAAVTELASATQTPELAPPPTAIILPTLAPNPTATLDTRLPPERWQEWPVVPAVTGRAIEIYQQGLAMGNNTHAFSKVGDCQSVKAAFMGFFDIPERYNLGPDYQYLQETIDNFAGYFNTDGQAVKGGFNAATVLSPLWANPDVCLAGENPLECELRVTKPSIAFISFEVWWEGRTVEEYEKYMRQIIETVIARGTVPILATKADNVEGDHSLNLTTARLAHEYDLPLWNFWLAVQPLPNHGMDPERDDGFHISTDGWNVRSYTGLQALDSIWHGVRDEGAASNLATPTPTSAPSGTSGLLPTPASGPTLAGSSERLVFGLAARQGSGYQPEGVYLFDFATETSAQLLGSGWDFQAASPDGRTLLVNLGDSLYRTDGLSLTLLTDQFYSYGQTGALYLPDGSLVFVLRQGAGTALARTQADGSGLTVLTGSGEAPIELYPSTDGVRLTWESGSCSAYGVCDQQGAWLTDLQTGQSRSLAGISRPLVSPEGAALAYEYIPEENKSNLAFATADGVPIRTFPVFGDILADYAWQPGGGWLAVHMAVRSDYSGRVTDGGNYLVDPQTLSTRALLSVLLLNPSLVWSPDGLSLAWLGTDWLETRYVIRLYRVDVESGQAANLIDSLGLGNTRYIFVTNAAWLAKP
jgi:hypothetical protein